MKQSLDSVNQRLDEHDGRLKEMREYITIRDKKVNQMIETVDKFKQEQMQGSIRTSKKFAEELKSRDHDILTCNRLIRSMDGIIQG